MIKTSTVVSIVAPEGQNGETDLVESPHYRYLRASHAEECPLQQICGMGPEFCPGKGEQLNEFGSRKVSPCFQLP